jgi:hypothetical protein
MRPLVVTQALILPLCLVLSGCGGTRLEVRDRGTGVAVVQAQAVIIAHGRETVVDEADGQGRLRVTVPSDSEAVVAVRARGFLQWSKPAGWFLKQPETVSVDLEPVWLGDFMKTGVKPSQIVTPQGCKCHQSK